MVTVIHMMHVVGCYGVSESQSVASTASSASTAPWFCDACKAGVTPVSHCTQKPYSRRPLVIETKLLSSLYTHQVVWLVFLEAAIHL